MSQENVEILRRGFEAFVRGDFDSALADVHEDFVATRVAPMPDITPYYGPEGLMQIFVDWTADFDEFEMSPSSGSSTPCESGSWSAWRYTPASRRLSKPWAWRSSACGGPCGQRLAPDLFMVTAARMRAFKACSSTSSPSWKSMARLVFPSRLELKRPEGSSSAAPFAKVILTTFL